MIFFHINGRKNLLITLLMLVFCGIHLCSHAQNYASGNGTGALQHEIFWLTWDNGLSSKPADATATNITAGKYEWQFSPTVKIVANLSSIVSLANNCKLIPYTYGGWYADGMDELYPDVKGAGMKTSIEGGQVRFNITIDLQMLINGVWKSTPYPGMVIGDAESLADGEYIKATSNGPIAWQMIDLRKESFANTDLYQLQISNNGKDFRFSLVPGNNDIFVQAVMFAKGATQLTNVEMKGRGSTALAIGFVIPFDYGDAPQTFNNPGHYIDSFAFSAPFTMMDGTYPITSVTKAILTPIAQVFLGNNNTDADGNILYTTTANADDSIMNDDEKGFDITQQPTIKVNTSNDVVVNLSASNLKLEDATVYGWIDFDGDGKFSANEAATPAKVVGGANNQNVTLVFPNAAFSKIIRVGTAYARFRITTTGLTDNAATTTVDERSTSVAADGEAEDFLLNDIVGLSLSGSCFNDKNGLTDSLINGIVINKINNKNLFVYLTDTFNVVLQKVAVANNGTYNFSGLNNGYYRVVPDTASFEIGQDLSGLITTWTDTWAYIGKNYGTNNLAATGIAPISNIKFVSIQTPVNALDVKKVDFAFNQYPIAKNDTLFTNIDKPVTVDAGANDVDIDGNVVKKTVLLIDPITNTLKTTVTIPNEGTYTVNTLTGLVTFTPVTGFVGMATPVQYAIQDNVGLTSNLAMLQLMVRPVGVNDADITTINTPVTVPVIKNDGTSGINTQVTIATQPTNGTMVVNADNTVTYTPNNFFKGVDSCFYTLVTKDGVSSAPIKVTITVTANPRPVGVNDTGYTIVNAPINMAVKNNDGTTANNTLLSIGTNPPNGNVTINNDNTIKYVPATGFAGKDVYTYVLTTTDGISSAPITVTVYVKPVGVNDVDSTTINTPVVIPVRKNDTFGGFNTSTVLQSAPKFGNVLVNADGTVTYTPNNNFAGKDSFYYNLQTPDGLISDPVKCVVTVKPKANADIDSTLINNPVNIPITKNDVPGGATPMIGCTAQHGNAVINGTSIQYTPATGFVGKDTLCYQLVTPDGISSTTVPVIVYVKPVGNPDVDTTIVGTPITTKVIANDLPADAKNVQVQIGSQPVNGSVVVNTGGNVVYTPNTGFAGIDVYYYNLVTADGLSTTPVKVTVYVKPVGVNDVDTIDLNASSNQQVKLNDVKGGNNTIVQLYQQPLNGSVVLNANQSITYTPTTNFLGKDTLLYRLMTPDSVYSSPVKVTIYIRPVGVNDVDTTPINVPITLNITNNDGVSGQQTVIELLQKPNHGIVALTGRNVLYTPATNYLGKDVFTYKLTTADSIASKPVTVTAYIKPVGVNDADTTLVNTAVNQKVVLNDGASGVTTNVVLFSNPTNGTVVVNNDKTITYTPNRNYTGTDTYYYTLTTADGVASNPIQVTVLIKPVVVKSADLMVEKTIVSTGDIAVGKDVTFKITVTNKGADTATQISVTDVLSVIVDAPKSIIPSIGTTVYNPNTKLWQWNISQLPVNGVATCTFSVRINAGGTLVNTATVAGKEPDPDFSNNTSTIEPVDIQEDIFIPNVITPNNDGRNDYFVIVGLGNFANTELSIFNRWDNLVYRATNYANNWEGKGLAAGTYYYIFKFATTSGTQVKKGWVTIIR